MLEAYPNFQNRRRCSNSRKRCRRCETACLRHRSTSCKGVSENLRWSWWWTLPEHSQWLQNSDALLLSSECRYYFASAGERSIGISLYVCVCVSVCLSASISLEPLYRSSRNFLCRSAVAVARSSSSGVAICYVLPVLWMTSRLAVMGATPKRGGCNVQRRPWGAWRYRGGVWCLWMFWMR